MQTNKHKHLHSKHHTVKYAAIICFELEWMSCCWKLGPSDELSHLVDLLGTADNPCFDVVCDLLFTLHLYKFTSMFYGRPELLSFLRKRDPVLPCWSWWLCCMWGSGIQPKKFKKGDIFHCIAANLMPCYAWFSFVWHQLQPWLSSFRMSLFEAHQNARFCVSVCHNIVVGDQTIILNL